MQLGIVLSTAVNAILPILLLIVLGFWLRKTGFLTGEFAKIANKFVFRVGLSCSLFLNVYNIPDLSAIPWDFVVYVVAVICLLFVAGLFAAVATTKLPQRRGAIVHAIFRSNFAIIGLPLAAALGGDAASSVASVVSAFAMPLYNVLGVFALTVFDHDPNSGKTNPKRIVMSIVKNPMIIGAFLGLICLLLREGQGIAFGRTVFSIKAHLPFVYKTVNHLKTVTSPLALIVLGAQFEFSAVKGMFKEIAAGSLLRIVFAPLMGIGGAVLLSRLTPLLNCGVNEYPTLIALFGSPAAVSTAIMAAEMGSDEQLATQIVVWTSIGSVVTIFLTACILMSAGLLAA